MVFPVVMYGRESWTVKKSEHPRIDAFELWCWRRLLRVPWTARRSNQSILKEISPGILWKEWCWSWNSSTLASSHEELTHWKRLWCWEWLGAGGEGDDRGWDGWMASMTRWTWVWVNSGSLWYREAWRAVIHGVAKSQTQLSHWSDLISSDSLEPCIQLGISFPFSLAFCFSSFLSYVKHPQTTTLPSWISFSLGWILSLAPIQCYESLATVLQILCLPDLTPWICHLHCINIRDLI